MKGRTLMLLACVFTLALAGSVSMSTARSQADSTAPVVLDQPSETSEPNVSSNDAGLVPDPFLQGSPTTSMVPVTCTVCRTNEACTVAGARCAVHNPNHLKCACSFCNGTLQCLPA